LTYDEIQLGSRHSHFKAGGITELDFLYGIQNGRE